MITVGVTGGIGSGKSVVCQVFRQLGIPVYNADTEARKLINSSSSIRQSLLSEFGNDIYSISGELNKKKLADIIYNDKTALAKVNSITHPQVKEHFLNWLKDKKSAPYTIKEAAILFETGIFKELDKIILVTAPEPIRIKRVVNRDRTDEASVQRIIDNQLKDDIKIKQSDFVIVNDGSEMILPQILEIHRKLMLLL